MRLLHDFAIEAQCARSLAILLPGAMQQPEDYVQAGFVKAVRQRNLPLDLSLVDPGLEFIGETADGSALQRLHDSVLQPARLKQYEKIWLVGISIGGFMAISYADHFPNQVCGLCLLAPYPGNRILTGEIEAAGGLLEWHPESGDLQDAERRVWRWLKTHRQHPLELQLHLGYGNQDRFATGLRLMSQAFPADCIDTVDGGHDWPAWLQLWENFLDKPAFLALDNHGMQAQ